MMIAHYPHQTTASDLRQRLVELERERATVGLTPLAANDAYTGDLAEDLAAVRSAFIGLAVTEIASLRAALGGPLRG